MSFGRRLLRNIPAPLVASRLSESDRATLALWVASNPCAWSGWPTYTSGQDGDELRARASRLAQWGCPVKGWAAAVEVDRLIAAYRLEHRAIYRRQMEACAW